MKKILAFALALIMLLSMVACSTAPKEADPTPEDTTPTESGEQAVDEAVNATESEDKLKIGLSVYSLSNPYFVEVANGAQKRCDELGIELIVNDPNSDAAAQVTAIENFITVGCDAIIISALDVAAVESVLQDAKAQGIAIISQSSCTETRDVWVSADEYNMGYTCGKGAADWLLENYGADTDISVLVLCWDQISTQILRGDGMSDAITEVCPNVKIIRQDANTTDKGNEVANATLQANPDLQAIVCINDGTAIGAYAAVQAAGKDDEGFYIGSIDDTEEGENAILEGNCFRATVNLIPYENGAIDVDLAVQLIKGEDVEDPYIIPAKLVTYEDLLANN